MLVEPMKVTLGLQATLGYLGELNDYIVFLPQFLHSLRNSNHITETLYRRAADVLNVDEKILHSSHNAEEMQV